MIWRRQLTLNELREMSQFGLVSHLGIEITEMGEDYLVAIMPVDQRTQQPFGRLHGGASVVLAETLGSVAGYCCTEKNQGIVGVEVNASHLRGVKEGIVTGRCQPLHLGRRQQVWSIDIWDDAQRLVCVSRLTAAVITECVV